MSRDWVSDIEEFNKHFGFDEYFKSMSYQEKRDFLMGRKDFLKEEISELEDRMNKPEEVVDALIDLCYVAIGTLSAFEVDADKAWATVHEANIQKSLRKTREGYNWLSKPEGWRRPDHSDNVGTLPFEISTSFNMEFSSERPIYVNCDCGFEDAR